MTPGQELYKTLWPTRDWFALSEDIRNQYEALAKECEEDEGNV